MKELTTNEIIYELALERARDEMKGLQDSGYGCGTSFVTIKWGSFAREMKQKGLAEKSGYYGWILETQENVNGTLEQERYNQEFARALNEQGVQAFVHTYLN